MKQKEFLIRYQIFDKFSWESHEYRFSAKSMPDADKIKRDLAKIHGTQKVRVESYEVARDKPTQ